MAERNIAELPRQNARCLMAAVAKDAICRARNQSSRNVLPTGVLRFKGKCSERRFCWAVVGVDNNRACSASRSRLMRS